MFADRLAERLALLRVGEGVFERRPRDADAASRDVDPLALEPRHDLPEAFAFHAADQVLGRDEEILERQLAVFHTAVAERVDLADDAKSGPPLLDDKGGNSLMRWVGVRLCLGGEHKSIAPFAVG